MQKRSFHIDRSPISLDSIIEYLKEDSIATSIEISEECKKGIEATHKQLVLMLERSIPIYGVNTGFGDSLFRSIPLQKTAQLQNNLVSYLMCGVGKKIPRRASKATTLFRMISLTRGYSGVSVELVEAIKDCLEREWVPVIPCQGSLGASGDLVPLAYVTAMLRGDGEIETPEGIFEAKELFQKYNKKPYEFKPKEALAIVNGTSTMCGMGIECLLEAEFLVDIVATGTAWLCMGLKGRTEAFSPLINEKGKIHSGQAEIAKKIRTLLQEEDYSVLPITQIDSTKNLTNALVQDRYSLRCTPQVMGPVLETNTLFRGWLEAEINGVSDNPLIDEEGNLANGGNFYGGYLSQGLDYLKISLGHVADLIDRQVTYIVDEKSNRGLPANLAAWNEIPEEDRFLHHGLKGVHQTISAVTSEILAKTMPNGSFSRSSESHNQDKVSLGMSAAIQTQEILDSLYSITAMYLVCLTQALDIQGRELRGSSKNLYEFVRGHVSFVEKDKSLGFALQKLAKALRERSHQKEPI